MTAARLKRSISNVNPEEDYLNKRKRLTRSTFGSTLDIPIVLDSSDSDSESRIDELEKLERVLASGRIVAAAAKKKGARRPTEDAPVALPQNEITTKKTEVTANDGKKGKEKQDLRDAATTESVVETSGAPTPPSSSSSSSSYSSLKNPALNLDSKPRLKPALKSVLKPPSKHASPKKQAKSVTIDTTTARISSSVSNPIRRLKISLPTNSDNALVANNQEKNTRTKASDNGSTATDVVSKLDPENQKPYRDTYSICCISCSKNNRSEYCNRQKPCDICTGKKLKNCHYPPSATIAIPAVRKSAKPQNAKSPASPVKSTYAQVNNVAVARTENSMILAQNLAATQTKKEDARPDFSCNPKGNGQAPSTKTLELEAKISSAPKDSSTSESSESCVDDSKSKIRVGALELKNLKVNVNSPLNSRPDSAPHSSTQGEKPLTKSKNRYGNANVRNRKKKRVIPSSDDENIDSMADYEDNSSENPSSSEDSDDYSHLDDDSDVGIDNDDDDDDDDRGRKVAKKKTNVKANRSEGRKRSTTPQDNFSRAQRILKTLEFEKRDIGDIYVPTTRRKRNATKENYYIPSDQEDNANDVEGNGYAAAEARNEQLILSEDEQERRILRGEIGLDYIKSMRNEREKYNHYSSDSLSSSDPE
ncbi:hypothetical protein PMKS-003460 [Pichia membranifaciens]|uniref:Uncharacterized protein n=1 Tax=Pichia membranifaciens TaxID=4926 RepID=A0A1Q2YK85_9ASCO|nr:hypothetical protein PMKS-003460 [Pichia membranifaciens]